MEKKLIELRNELESLSDVLGELEEKVTKFINIDVFLDKLKIDNYNLYEQIKPFVEEFIKYYND
ncbi:MAG: hypothetical protein IJL74_00615 [Bacilli bacterium]|nr:hypothetical protein [Bacilli bacterium]